MKVLLADDDKISRLMVRDLLLKWGYEVIEAEDGNQAWDMLHAGDSPRLVLLDWVMPGMDGIELCRQIRQSGGYDYHYLILLTGLDSKEDIIKGLEGGADDYITKPFVPQELEARLRIGYRILSLQRSLEEALQLQRYQAQHDSLTGLLNHAQILTCLEKEMQRVERQETSLVVLMGDLDHFKKVNDSYGHTAGDAVLVEIALRMRDELRTYDSIGRYGGEEFLILLPGCTKKEGSDIANRIRERIQAPPVMFHDTPISVTISMGLVEYTSAKPTGLSDLVQRADQAMYAAKQNGRNRVEQA